MDGGDVEFLASRHASRKKGRAERILGDFYEVEIFPNEFDGDDERR
jgi:hypothetical protein